MKKEPNRLRLNGVEVSFRLREEADSDQPILVVDVYRVNDSASSPIELSELEKEIREAIISYFQETPS